MFKFTTRAYVVENVSGQLSTSLLAKFVDFDVPDLPLTDWKYAHMDLMLDGDLYAQIM